MATTGATITSINDILKEYYIGPLQEQLNNEVMVLNMFEKAKISWAGKKGVVPVHVGRNTGVAFRAEDGELKGAGKQTVASMTFTAAYLYGRFEVTGPAIASAAKGGTASFIGALELEMDKLKEDVRNQADRTAISGGRVAGFLNQTRVAPGGADDWEFRGDFQKLADCVAVLTAGKKLQVDIVNNNNLQLGEAESYNKIATVDLNSADAAAGTLNFSDFTTSDVAKGGAASVVVAATQQDEASTDAVAAILDAQPIGVYGNLASEVHFSIDRGAADVTQLQSIIRNAAGTAAGTADNLSLTRMQEMIDTIELESGLQPDVILMNPIDRVQYINLLNGEVWHNSQTSATSGDGGFLGLSYGGIPIKAGRHIDRGLMLFLNTKCWKLAVLEDGKFADLDGSVLARVSGKDNWEGFYKWYYNHYCYRPNAQGILTGIKYGL